MNHFKLPTFFVVLVMLYKKILLSELQSVISTESLLDNDERHVIYVLKPDLRFDDELGVMMVIYSEYIKIPNKIKKIKNNFFFIFPS